MNNYQENQLSMAKAVQHVLNDNISIVSSVTAFQTAKTDLDSIITSIDSATQFQVGKITGSAKDKKEAARVAIEAAIKLIGPVKSYAKDIGNNSLYEAFNYSPSSFKKLRDTELANTLTTISGNMQANMANLANYGIANTDLTSFNTLIAAYHDLITAPRNAISKKSAATFNVAQAIANIRPVLIRLDGFMAAKKDSNRDFYTAYQTARVLVVNKGKPKTKAVANTTPQQQ
jgi:hypothetical protein